MACSGILGWIYLVIAACTSCCGILGSGTISEQQRNQTSIKGTTAVLPCTVQHDSSVNVSWLWFFSNRLTPIISGERFRISPLGSLSISSVRSSDIGSYSCYAISDGGNATTTLFLNVIELPYPPVVNNVSLSSTSNTSIVVYWTASYDGNSPILGFILKYLDVTYVSLPPKCDDTWKVVDSSIPATNNFYVIKNLQYSNSYQVCMSSFNEVGESDGSSSSLVITLPQHAPSSAPIIVSALPKSNSSISLQWKMPDPNTWNGAPLGYLLRYKLSGYPDSTYIFQEVTPFGQTVSKDVSGLIVWQEYEVAVALFNAAGIGVYSSIIKVKTEEGIPSAAPKIQKLEPGSSSTEVIIQWLPPPPQSINGVNLGYKIFVAEIKGGNGTGEFPVRVNVSAVLIYTALTDSSNVLGLQSYTIKELKKFQTYEVCIVCFTAKGSGPSSNKVFVTTNEDVPGPVANMKFTEVKDSSLIIIWEPPLLPNGILTGYNLSYWQTNFNETTTSLILSPNITSRKITNLLPTTLYNFRLSASTQIGEGSAVSAEITSGIIPIVPSPARLLVVSSIKERSAILTFVPGFDGYSSIINWIVEYRASQSTDWSFLYSISDPLATSILILNLHPNAKYQLRIISENIAGKSLPSEPSLLFETPQAPPSYPPMHIFVTPINETSLYVKWAVLAIADWNGEGQAYKVQWWQDSSSFGSASISNEVSSYRITGLNKFALYFVSIASCNVVGCSNFSVPVLQRTLESVPSSSPSNFVIVNILSTSAELNWLPVTVQYENGVVLGYKILFWRTGKELDGLSTLGITSRNITQCNVTSLIPYETYSVLILAFSNMGDGAKSQPLTFMTLQDVPGAPTKVCITNIGNDFVTLNWDEPSEKNGIITGFKVGYKAIYTGESSRLEMDSFENKGFIVDDSLDPNKRDFTIRNLLSSTIYEIFVSAKTSIGWGLRKTIAIYTSITFENPPMPISLFATPVDDQSATLTFKLRSGKDLILIRNFTVEILRSGKSLVVVFESFNSSETTSLNITNLKPFTSYKFRVSSCNDVGCSNLSSWSNEITTFGTLPSSPPGNLSVLIVSESSVLLSWIIPPQSTWNGPQTGYEVFYRDVTKEDGEWLNIILSDINQSNVTIGNLGSFMTYLFKIRTVNLYGKSFFSAAVIKFIELIPLSWVTELKATGIYSRSVNVSWSFSLNRTFVILGFKITCSSLSDTTYKQQFTLPPDVNKSVINQLKPYSTYIIDVVPYNDAGNGRSASPQLQVTTNEDVPEQVRNMKLIVIAPSVVNISWLPPASSNGILLSYEISYYQSNTSEGIKSNVLLDLPLNSTNYLITRVIESTNYIVTLRSRTKIGWSQITIGSIYIGPQPGCPGPSSKPSFIVDGSQVIVTWTNGNQGSYAILGSFIQSKVSTELSWTTVSFTNGKISTVVLNTTSLTPNSDVQVKVIHYNEAGIGESSPPSEFFRIAENTKESEKPFYQQWWFLLIMALVGLIVIIVIILVLVLTTRKKEPLKTSPQRRTSTTSKSDFTDSRSSNNFLQLRLNPLDFNESSTDDPVPFERSNNSLRFSLRNGSSSKAVPRSRGGFKNESYDDDGDDDDDYLHKSFRSLSERVSDITTSNSQVHGVKVIGDDSPMEWRKKSSAEPPSSSPFSNHNHYYVNKDDIHPPWGKVSGHHNSSQNFTYEESSLPYGTGSSVVVMNNKPGSRAPLPQLSFFE